MCPVERDPRDATLRRTPNQQIHQALSPLPALMINIYAISKNLDIDSPVLSPLPALMIAVWKAPSMLAAAVGDC